MTFGLLLPTLEVNILTILIFFGSFQAFILAFILVISKKFRRKSGFYLALVLLALGLINISTGFFLTGAELRYEFLQYSPQFLVTLIPASLYFFIRYLVTPAYKWRSWDYLIWIVVGIEFTHRFYRFITYMIEGEPSNNKNLKYYFSSNIYESVAVIATLVTVVWAIKKLSTHEKLLYQNYSEVEERSLDWLRSSLIAGLGLTLAWSISLFFELSGTFNPSSLIQYVVIGLTTLICYTGYAMILRPGIVDTEVFGIVPTDIEVSQDKNQAASLSSKAKEHMNKLRVLMEDDRIYRDPDLNMTKLAERSGLSNSYVSQIINNIEGKNFFDYVNSYRVEEVKRNMTDPSYAHYTILGLAEEAGFKSKSTFNAVFKKITRQTPSQYKKSLRSDNQ